MRNFSNLGDGATSDLARLKEGSAAALDVGLCWASAFHLRTGLQVDVCLGLVSVEACLLPQIGETAGGTAGVSGNLMGDPSDEEKISSITGEPCLVELLLTNP